MKSFFLALCVACLGQAAIAQQHVLKLRPFQLIGGSIAPSYEYVVNDNGSLNLSASFLIPRSAPAAFEPTDIENYTINTNRTMGFSGHVSYRFYTAGNAPDGFYLAPFFRYWRTWIDYDWENNSLGINEKVQFGFSSTAVGLQIGYQWLINDKWTIDWGIAGLGGTRMSVFGSYATDDAIYTDSDVAQVTEDWGEIPLVGDRVDVDIDGDEISVKASFPFLAWRSFLSVGIVF